tara:strand:- start:1034 stop:1231 length:198 start_codon:yes stop_codon:yes gene_type:complete
MASQDYWAIKYKKADGTKQVQHIEANYKQYDVEKIKKVFNEVHSDWEILDIYKVENLKFKEPDGG